MRSRSSRSRKLAFLHVVLALLVQFAPLIHALTPHRHESATCKHGTANLHVEAGPAAESDVPCLVCEHILNRQALTCPVGLLFRIDLVAVANLPSLAPYPAKTALETPGNRGPPPTL